MITRVLYDTLRQFFGIAKPFAPAPPVYRPQNGKVVLEEKRDIRHELTELNAYAEIILSSDQ